MRHILVLLLAISSFCFAAEGDVVKVGDSAPEISGTSTDGEKISLKAFKGKVVIVSFFATWCRACVEEIPELEQMQKDNPALIVIEVGREHSMKEVADFKKTKGFGMIFVADPWRAMYRKYANAAIPRAYLVGKDGKLKFAMVGLSDKNMNDMKKHVVEELSRKDAKDDHK